MLVVPAKETVAAIRACADKGVRSAIIGAVGFAETGTPEGPSTPGRGREPRAPRRSAAAWAQHQRHHNTSASLSLGYNAAHGYAIAPGPVSIVSHSGALFGGLIRTLEQFGVGLSKFVPVGNEADLDMLDILDYAIEDPDTGHRPRDRGARKRRALSRARAAGKGARQADRRAQARPLRGRGRRRARAFEPARRRRARLRRAVCGLRRGERPLGRSARGHLCAARALSGKRSGRAPDLRHHVRRRRRAARRSRGRARLCARGRRNRRMAGRGGRRDRRHGFARPPAQSARRRRARRLARPRAHLSIAGTRRVLRSDGLLRPYRAAPGAGRDPARGAARAQGAHARADRGDRAGRTRARARAAISRERDCAVPRNRARVRRAGRAPRRGRAGVVRSR